MTKLFTAKPYIIAEVGSNWLTREHCIESIGIAASVGADCAKFQAFTHESLYGWAMPDGNDLRHALPLHWLPKLKEKADACGIDFMVTAFSPSLVQAVDPFVSAHKVASSDATYPQLLEAVAKTGKPVLLSTGAKSFEDIKASVALLRSYMGIEALFDRVVLLYCVASYPARTVDLRVIDMLVDCFELKVGFSDHTTDIINAPVFAARGVDVIEKHFTAFPALDTPDRPHSLTPDEFKVMVDHIRGTKKPTFGPSTEEKAMILRHNRRLVATKCIAPGEVYSYGVNFGAFRSTVDDTRGLIPFAWGAVEGKTANRAFSRGEAIGPGDFT